MGMGVSGGEEGARNGPSLMPGGPREAYERVQPILEAIAAKTNSGACVAYVGELGSGNYVKMVHNGIEYGDMQLIAEAYDILKTVGGLTNEELHGVFSEWNKGELDSYLIEITAKIFAKKEEDGCVARALFCPHARRRAAPRTSARPLTFPNPLPPQLRQVHGGHDCGQDGRKGHGCHDHQGGGGAGHRCGHHWRGA
jgi:hypothetical protein